MQLASVLLARVLGYVEVADLNPQGRFLYPELVKAIREKFEFLKFPQKPEDFDESKGVEFGTGHWGDIAVDTFRIYTNGFMLDTRASTDESERILREGLDWAASTFGLNYSPKMITRTGYLNQIAFYSDAPLLSNSPASKLAERVHNAVSQMTGDQTAWAPVGLTLQSETVPKKPVIAAFTIQRRVDTFFSENKYFSEAPLPTELHNRLLNSYEADVIALAFHDHPGTL